MNKEEIKKYLKEARSKGWWIDCLYWERKLDKLEEEQKGRELDKLSEQKQ